MSRHRGAKHRRRYELLAVSACYPQSTFYPLSDGPSMWDHRITMTCFRNCPGRAPRSKAGLCHCTDLTVSDRDQPTFVLLRYALGGDRPSQTSRQTLSPGPEAGG